MSCLVFPTELMVSPVGSSLTGVRQLRTPQFGMLLAQSRDTVPSRGKGRFKKKLLLIDVVLFQSYDL